MSHKLTSEVKVVTACIANVGTVGSMTAVEVAGAGFGRALYVINLGTATTNGKYDCKIQEASASGGTFGDITSAALTQVTKAAGDGKVFLIDVPVNPAKPFQQIVAATTTAAFPNAVTTILYRGTRAMPPTQAAGETVIV